MERRLFLILLTLNQKEITLSGGVYCNTLLPYLLPTQSHFISQAACTGHRHTRVNIQTIALQGSEIPQIKRLTLSVVSCKGKIF